MSITRDQGGVTLSSSRGYRPNPVFDILESLPFRDLASSLRAHLQPIIERWEQLVREVLPAADALTLAQVRDHLPQTLTKLADALESATSDETRALIGQTGMHGAERFDQGYNVEELIIEYRILRRVVIEQVESSLCRRTTTAEDIALSMGIDTVLQQGVVSFVKHQADRLRAANQAEAKYLSFLSHDLRGQLNGISLTMELLKRQLRNRAGFEEEISDIHTLQSAVAATVEGMQRLLQAERLRRAEPKRAPVNLHALASDVAMEFTHQAERKGITLSIDIAHDAVVRSDREWLQLILQNLVSNAVKYSTGGTVRVKSDAPCNLSVSDEGPGIPPQYLAGIFEAFRRGDTHGQPGVGLGLAIAAQAAKVLGAEITVKSTVGVGSTFCLCLPVDSE